MAFRMSAATSTASTARLAARAAPFTAVAPARPMAARPASARQALQVAAGMKAGVGVFGEKAGMTQVFTEDGKVLPVTVISVANGNVVTMVRLQPNCAPCTRAEASPIPPGRSLDHVRPDASPAARWARGMPWGARCAAADAGNPNAGMRLAGGKAGGG